MLSVWLCVCLDVCLDVKQGGTNRNRCTHRLVILCAQTYYWTLIALQKTRSVWRTLWANAACREKCVWIGMLQSVECYSPWAACCNRCLGFCVVPWLQFYLVGFLQQSAISWEDIYEMTYNVSIRMLSPSVPYVVSGVHWIVCGKHCCGQYYWDVPGYDWIHWNVKYCSMWKSYIAHFTRVRESLADGLIFRCSSVPVDLLDWKICVKRSWPIGSWSCRLSRGATWEERILKNSRWICLWTSLDSNYQSLDLVLFATCECGIVMSSVVSVYVSVCTIQALSFEGLYLGISFSLWRYILRISRPSSYVKVIGSRSRSQEQKVCTYVLLGPNF